MVVHLKLTEGIAKYYVTQNRLEKSRGESKKVKSAGLIFYVAPDGNDAWSGSIAEPNAARTDGPFATLERARDAVRALKRSGRLSPGGLAVEIRGGLYRLDRPFALTTEDSGIEGAPIVWRARCGERVRLIGGRQIQRFCRVSDEAVLRRLPEAARGQVLQADLREHGVTEYGQYRPRGHGGGFGPAALEVFFNGRPMTVARWPKKHPLPNRGFELVADVLGDALVYSCDRPRHWTHYEDIYLHGYFSLDWASTIVRVVSLNPEKKEITTDPPRTGHYGVRKGGRFFFFNVIDELGEPGEYYVDRKTGTLYFWPPEPVQDAETLVSVLEEPLVHLENVEHVRLERLTVECTRGDGVAIRGGRRVTLAGCTLCNIGRDGVRIEGGFEHTVLSCDIFETGECGVFIEAGDRRTLTPCNHRVHNCHIHHVAREGWTYFPTIELRGCGVVATHNRLHDHRHTLLFYRGNDHRIEYNECYNFTLEGDDCGCMYTGRDFSYQGHIVRCNYVHHAGDSGRNEWGSSGVYMDDCAGGTLVRQNVFYLVNKGVLAGGGVNTHVENNIFVQCSPAVWFDERGASARRAPGSMVHEFMRDRFYEVGAHHAPYLGKYPLMDYIHEALQKGTGVLARNGRVVRNLIVGSAGQWLNTHWAKFPDYFECRDNLETDDPHFVDPKFGIFQLRDDSRAYHDIGFERIPFEEIGLVKDEYRTAIEDVWTAIEIVRPPAADGSSGRARLIVKNVGDVPVEGVELVEFKVRRHGPGAAHAEVPYRAAPGQTGVFEFDVALPPGTLADVQEVFLFSRGERIRPAWAAMPVAFLVESRLETLRPIAAGRIRRDGLVRLTLRNATDEVRRVRVRLAAEPEGACILPNGNELDEQLSEGETHAVDVPVVFAGAKPLPQVLLRAVGDGVKPSTLHVPVEHHVLVIERSVTLEEMAAALKDELALAVCASTGRAPAGHLADVQLGIFGDAMGLVAKVYDKNIRVTELLWDGSCVEMFGTSVDRQRIGHVFGALPIGQVYLVPAWEGQVARGLVQKDNAQHPAPEIRVWSELVEGGYRLAALVPLQLLATSRETGRFLFEMQITANTGPGNTVCRSTLFGSAAAFNNTSSYGLVVM